MTPWIVAAAAGIAAALILYAGGRPGGAAGTRRLLPAALRAVGVALLVALLLDAPAGRRRPVRPIAALDASESWRRGGDTATWHDAVRRAGALRADSLLLVGDSVRAGRAPDRPADAASGVRALVDRALAAGRPVALITDGEVDDADALASLPGGSSIEVLRSPPRPDAAAARLDAPRSAVGGDTIEVRVAVVAGEGGAAAGQLTVTLAGVAQSRALDATPAFGEQTVAVRLPLQAPDGPALLRAVVATPGDVERSNDTLTTVVDVSAAAGAVFVSTSPDYDARFAMAVLRGALNLPTRGYYRVTPTSWRLEGTLAPVAEEVVRRAVREAPLVVLHGDTALFGPPRQASRGALALVAPPPSDGEWFATGAPASPMAASLAGLPWDSLPPLAVAERLPPGDWQGLETRRGRRFERRPAIAGVDVGGRRVVVVGASGFWRWQFRAGAGAGAFATLWGSIFDWLAAERGDVRAALPADAVVRAGEPVRWRRGSGTDTLVVVRLVRRGTRPGGPAGGDSLVLRFASGATITESAPLPPGVYDVRARGGDAVLAVNVSREWIPRRPGVRAGRIGSAAAVGDAPALRMLPWIYGLVLVALCAEWLLRRRAGLR